METRQRPACTACPMQMGRRRFLTTVGASALAVKMGLLDFASSLLGGEWKAAGQPRLRAVFVRPKGDSYWMGWPGAAYDIKARQADYTRTLTEAAKQHGVELDLAAEPISDPGEVNTLLEQLE